MVTFDPDALQARVDELEQELAQPDFWNDQQRAAKLSAEHQRAQRKLQRYHGLLGNVEFLREGMGTFLILWAVFTAFLVVPCTRISVLLTVLFSAATVTFVLLAIGAYASSDVITRAAGYTGFVVGILGLYGCFASVVNATWHRTVIPLGSRE